MRRMIVLALIAALHLLLFHWLSTSSPRSLQHPAPQVVMTTLLPVPTPPPSQVTASREKPIPPPIRKAPPPPMPHRPVRTPPVKAPAPAPPPAATPTPPAPLTPNDAPVAAVTPAAPAAPAAPAVAPTTAPPQRPALRTLTTGIQYLRAPQPDYPPQSKRIGEEGTVVMRVLVDEHGMPGPIEIRQSSGFGRLDQAAIAAVRQAVFRPALDHGEPVPAYVIVPITFRLDQ